MKRLISIFLVLATVLTLTAAAAPAQAEEEAAELAETYGVLTYEINDDNTITITDCDRSATEVTIPAEIDGRSVTSIGEFAFDGCSSLISVDISDSITNIEGYAFAGCSSLKNIELPDNLEKLSFAIFHSCTSLDEIYIPDNTIIEYYNPMTGSLFVNCNSLKNINVSNENINYTTIDGILFSKDRSVLIGYPPGRIDATYEVSIETKVIGAGAFQTCNNLKRIFISEGVTDIEAASVDAENIELITIPKSLVNMGPYNPLNTIENIYYRGSQIDWERIIGIWNPLTINANVHFNAIGIKPPKITNAIVFQGSDAFIGNSVQVTLEDTEYDSTMITAFYKDGVMVDMQTTPISAGDITNTIPVSDLDADTANVFIWSSLDSMQSLCEAESIQL